MDAIQDRQAWSGCGSPSAGRQSLQGSGIDVGACRDLQFWDSGFWYSALLTVCLGPLSFSVTAWCLRLKVGLLGFKADRLPPSQPESTAKAARWCCRCHPCCAAKSSPAPSCPVKEAPCEAPQTSEPQTRNPHPDALSARCGEAKPTRTR